MYLLQQSILQMNHVTYLKQDTLIEQKHKSKTHT